LQNELGQYQQSYETMLQSYETLRISESESIPNLIQVEPASAPLKPIRPRVILNTVLAGIVGLLLILGVIILIEYLDDTIKTPEEAIIKMNIPVIGLIARIKSQKQDVPFVFENPRSPVTEAFRTLRTNIQFASVEKPIQTILITSPTPGEGKTLIAANLAVVMAQGGKRVILADFDLRKPQIHKLMGRSNRLGLSDLFIRDPLTLDGVLKPWQDMPLSVITSGGLPPNPAELLSSGKLKQILEGLKRQADVIIIDTPPVIAVTDSVILAAQSDAVILIVEPKRTRIGIALRALEQLKRANARVIGLVFNDVILGSTGYYSSEYYYHYAYHYEESSPPPDSSHA
jgi:polysaccharide biosynthesis transport protein